MKDLSSKLGFTEIEYIDIPRSGTRAYRDRHCENRPRSCIPFHPNYKVKIIFDTVTFTTNVYANEINMAKDRAMQNLMYTFYPEHTMNRLGDMKCIKISRM